jgi:hypothetical protein
MAPTTVGDDLVPADDAHPLPDGRLRRVASVASRA